MDLALLTLKLVDNAWKNTALFLRIVLHTAVKLIGLCPMGEGASC